jgi:hypothetical protein
MAEHLLKLVNASGFAFQLAIEEAVTNTEGRHGWHIVSREHGWRDGGTPRFIDLILAKARQHLFVECKRSRDADWVFLVPDQPGRSDPVPRSRFRTRYLFVSDQAGGGSYLTISNFQLHPKSYESSFCTVRGSSEKDPPMLDRICAELTRSADVIAQQQVAFAHGRDWVFVPVIITTARLHVCRFNPGDVPLDRGEILERKADIKAVTDVRYRKNFDVPPSNWDAGSLPAMEELAQRNVAVVTASHFPKWLEDFHMDAATY